MFGGISAPRLLNKRTRISLRRKAGSPPWTRTPDPVVNSDREPGVVAFVCCPSPLFVRGTVTNLSPQPSFILPGGARGSRNSLMYKRFFGGPTRTPSVAIAKEGGRFKVF